MVLKKNNLYYKFEGREERGTKTLKKKVRDRRKNRKRSGEAENQKTLILLLSLFINKFKSNLLNV